MSSPYDVSIGLAAPAVRRQWAGGFAAPQAPDALAPDPGYEPIVSDPLITRLDRLIGLLERHPEPRDKHVELAFTSPAGAAVGTILTYDGSSPRLHTSALYAWTFLVDNPSNYVLQETRSRRLIPQTTFNYPVTLLTAQNHLELVVFSGTDNNANTVIVVATERIFFKW